ncbi:MAG: hypothetical protein U0792_13205 [Gemmataceae bacterium]
MKQAVEVAERFADGFSSKEELETAARALDVLCLGEYSKGATGLQPRTAASLAQSSAAAKAHHAANGVMTVYMPPLAGYLGNEDEERSRICDLLRDIFGNPFRPITFDAEWRSDTALSLAKHIYESRDFHTMPILADALQDAGCDNADILSHCRDPQQVHVRGCWVVDLVLGKA